MSSHSHRSPGSAREVLAIAWPIWVSMISVTTKQVVDTVMVGRLGTDALAGVGLAGVLAFNALCFGMGVLRAQKSLVSQYEGAGDPSGSFSFGVHAFYLALGFSSVCLVVAAFSQPLFFSLAPGGLRAGAMEQGAAYFGTRLGWSGTMLLSLSVAEYLRGRGRTRLPMMADLISQPVNVALNYVLIFGGFGIPALGVKGAAMGTGLSDLFSLVLMLALSIPAREVRAGLAAMRLRLDRLKKVFTVGAAGGVQFTLEIGSFTVITWFIGRLGTETLAAHQAAISVLHFSFMSAVALADGGAVLVGRYVGALQWEAVRATFRSMLSLTIPVMALIGLLYFVFGRGIMEVYITNDDAELRGRAIRIGTAALAVAALWQIGDALQITYRFALRAAGDHTWVMWAGILCTWLLSVPLAWFAVEVLGGPLSLVWLLWSTEIYAGAYVFWRRWKSGAWQSKRLVEDRALPHPQGSSG